MRKTLIEIIGCMAALGFAFSAQASALFDVNTNPGGARVLLDKAKNAPSSFGDIMSTDDVTITVTGNADFSNGFSTIKPMKNDLLTTLTFTPANPNEFNSFSFRGQDLLSGQVIDVIVQDDQGHTPQTLVFTEGNADQDFIRQGIIAAMPGETIKSVELVDSGGFKDARQFEFGLAAAAAAVPEPAAWLLMIAGFGLLGVAMRRKHIHAVKA